MFNFERFCFKFDEGIGGGNKVLFFEFVMWGLSVLKVGGGGKGGGILFGDFLLFVVGFFFSLVGVVEMLGFVVWRFVNKVFKNLIFFFSFFLIEGFFVFFGIF